MKAIHNMMTKTILVLLATLTGCASNIKPTVDDQIATNVVVPLAPAQVYQNLVRSSKQKCYPLTIDAQFYQNTNSGDVSFISQFDAMNRITWIIFEIKPLNDSTAVTMMYKGRKNEFVEPAIKWMNGEDAKCPVS